MILQKYIAAGNPVKTRNFKCVIKKKSSRNLKIIFLLLIEIYLKRFMQYPFELWACSGSEE